jgi:predicted lipoprotein with Yx(FWY)xxD motif
MLDLPIGDFTIKAQLDGTRQWAYRGAALYSFDGDLQPGDLNGKEIEPNMSAVILFRYFLPAEVTLQKDERRGGRLVEAQTGHTLYARDRFFYAPVSYNARGLNRGFPQTGETIGLSGCDSECERLWHPLLAPSDGRPNGYWTVLDRPDGAKQWAYRSYALYTHPSEPPGATFGSEIWEVKFDGGVEPQKIDERLGLGLFWRVAVP